MQPSYGYGPPPPARSKGPSAAKIVLVSLAAVAALGFLGCVVWLALSGEKPADVAHPVTISRAGFTLRHPGNWEVDTGDSDYDPDHFFFLESPGACMVTMRVLDGPADPAQAMKDQLDAADVMIQGARRTPFARWGAYAGDGTEVRGKVLAVNDGKIRVFAHSAATRSFVVMELCYDDDWAMAGPGFAQIESSFQLSP